MQKPLEDFFFPFSINFSLKTHLNLMQKLLYFFLELDLTNKTRAWCQHCKVDLKLKLNIFKDHAQRKGHKTKMPLSNVNTRLQLPFRPVNIIPVEYKKVKLNLTAMAVCYTSFRLVKYLFNV
jgi:hypothetical protein